MPISLWDFACNRLILGVNTMYMLFCFFKLFLVGYVYRLSCFLDGSIVRTCTYQLDMYRVARWVYNILQYWCLIACTSVLPHTHKVDTPQFRLGDTVRVDEDMTKVKELQHGHYEWGANTVLVRTPLNPWLLHTDARKNCNIGPAGHATHAGW